MRIQTRLKEEPLKTEAEICALINGLDLYLSRYPEKEETERAVNGFMIALSVQNFVCNHVVEAVDRATMRIHFRIKPEDGWTMHTLNIT